MKTLLEVITPKCKILSEEIDEATKEKVMRVEVKWQHAGIINGNRRRYSKEILQREITRLTPLIEQGKVHGSSFHPKNDAEIDDVSHLWESARMESDGSCVGVVKVIPTARGKNCQALISSGAWIGMSSRGRGTTTQKEEVVDGKKIMVDEINSDYVLQSPGDFVLGPSVPDAGVLRMMESRLADKTDGAVSLDQLKEFGLVDEKLTEAEKEILIQKGFNQAMLSGFKGDLQDYRASFAIVKADRDAETKFDDARKNAGYKGDFASFKKTFKKGK